MKNVQRLPDFAHMLPPSYGASDAIVKMKTWMQYKRYDLRSICEHCNAATYFMRMMQLSSPEKISDHLLMIFETKELIQNGPFVRKRKALFDALKILLQANSCSVNVIDDFTRMKKKKRPAMAA
ncbi:MAG TPA: hypothetical protein VL651_17555 [Bacteroidia bacterium]|jgi:hypothetical protein|nr:hypothetical protein [Bacteroidia bacterium]